jgi:hypothetical protein
MRTLKNAKRYLVVALMAVTLATSFVATASAATSGRSSSTVVCGGPKSDGQETHG